MQDRKWMKLEELRQPGMRRIFDALKQIEDESLVNEVWSRPASSPSRAATAGVCRSEKTMSLLLTGALLSALLSVGAAMLASPDDPDGFTGS